MNKSEAGKESWNSLSEKGKKDRIKGMNAARLKKQKEMKRFYEAHLGDKCKCDNCLEIVSP